MYHKWQSHDVWFLRYGAWRTKFFVILDHILLFYPSKNPKNQNFEKVKNSLGDIIILHKCTKNHDRMLYCSWDMARERCNCYFSFWAIFCSFTSPTLTAQKTKFQKKAKNTWRYHHFIHVCQKLWLDDVRFLRYDERQTDGRTDGRKKWHIEVGAAPKKWKSHKIKAYKVRCQKMKLVWNFIKYDMRLFYLGTLVEALYCCCEDNVFI